jgi:hypothetical protein
MPSVQSGDRPPYLIAPDEVASWLADSVNHRVTFHRTIAQAAEEIRRRGVDISRSRIGAYGQGFYSATEPDAFFGDVVLPVAIRLVSPLVGDLVSVGDIVDSITDRLAPLSRRITPPIAAALRRELLMLGYDGIVVLDGGGDGVDYVVALSGQSVRVIQT